MLTCVEVDPWQQQLSRAAGVRLPQHAGARSRFTLVTRSLVMAMLRLRHSRPALYSSTGVITCAAARSVHIRNIGHSTDYLLPCPVPCAPAAWAVTPPQLEWLATLGAAADLALPAASAPPRGPLLAGLHPRLRAAGVKPLPPPAATGGAAAQRVQGWGHGVMGLPYDVDPPLLFWRR